MPDLYDEVTSLYASRRQECVRVTSRRRRYTLILFELIDLMSKLYFIQTKQFLLLPCFVVNRYTFFVQGHTYVRNIIGRPRFF